MRWRIHTSWGLCIGIVRPSTSLRMRWTVDGGSNFVLILSEVEERTMPAPRSLPYLSQGIDPPALTSAAPRRSGAVEIIRRQPKPQAGLHRRAGAQHDPVGQ